MTTPCVFCELMTSGEARWVARHEDAVAFLPLDGSRLAPGHTLVVPRRHCVGVVDAPQDVWHETTTLVQQVARAMTTALGATGVNLLNASGPASGQSVDHLHVHVVPRWPDDAATLWPTDRSAHEAIADVHLALAAALHAAG